ncbi:hypothetical protein SFA35_16170 [Pseudomonas sp. HR96]|uniref:hypothetical protein n=1 Tax=Pseudomonas sp. HR96 TaxID=1027966 RepID=UPI002A761383|nr:hypothetical protein [Pseudomonas sp. HR96]WPO98182.1 hypothetical protein SFA35_16170 [Pseudomonas sp. HR96]
MAHVEKLDTVLFRLRPQDTPTGISTETFGLLMAQTGMNKTEVIHYALRQLADRYLPKYELDDGPLTPEQMDAIKAASPALPDSRLTRSLF